MHTTTAVAPAADTSTRRQPLLLALLATAQLMLVLDVTVVNVALPDIGADLSLGRSTLTWVMTTYTLLFGGLVLMGGRLADLLGARRVMLTGLVVFTVASLSCALADGGTSLLAGRAAQGLGAALLSPAALAVLLGNAHGDARTRALAVWGGLSALGSALGVTLGGVVTSSLGWEWIFAINVPIGALVLVALPLLSEPVPGTPSVRLDVPGAVLVTAGTGAVVYGLVNAGNDGWSSGTTVLALVGGVALWALFAVVESRVAQPMLRLGLLRERPVAAGAFLMVVATGLMVGNFFIGSFALQRVYGDSALRVGFEFLPVAIAVASGAHLAGRLLARVTARAVASTGLALAALGEGAVALTDAGRTVVVAGLAVSAFGIGAVFVTAFTSALATAGHSEGGLRSAVVSTAHELGGAFGVAVLSTIAGSALTAARPVLDDFSSAFGVAAIAAGVAAVLARALVPAVVREAGAGGHHH